MFSMYANQPVGWKRRTETKPNGTPVFDEEKTIPGRFEHKTKMMRSVSGETVASEAQCFTQAPVSDGDVLIWEGREWPVQSVRVLYSLMGDEHHREVLL